MVSRKALGRFWLQRFGLVVLFLAVAASTINLLALSPQAKILPLIGGSGQTFLRPTETYQAAADKLLQSSIWNGNKVTIDSNRLSQQLGQQFPELASVSVTLPFFTHRPLVYIEPARPVLVLATGNAAYVVDDRGKVLRQATDAAAFSSLQLPLAHDQSGLGLSLNHQALSTANISFIQAVLAQLRAKHLPIADMTLPTATSELDVQLAGQPYYVKFNLQSTKPREQAGTLLATINQLQRQGVTPAHYVDVRVEGRAYYQ